MCKSCGEDSSVLNLIDNSRISDFNLGLSNITIGSKEVLLQDLRNPRGINFKVLISKRATCAKSSGVSTIDGLLNASLIFTNFSGSVTRLGLRVSLGKSASVQLAKLTLDGCSSLLSWPHIILFSRATKASTQLFLTQSFLNHVGATSFFTFAELITFQIVDVNSLLIVDQVLRN